MICGLLKEAWRRAETWTNASDSEERLPSMLVSMRNVAMVIMLAPGGEDAKLIHLLPTADERGKIHALPADPPGDVPRSVMV